MDRAASERRTSWAVNVTFTEMFTLLSDVTGLPTTWQAEARLVRLLAAS